MADRGVGEIVSNYIIIPGDCRLGMRYGMLDQSVHTVVTSPPYYNLRNYGVDGQIGLEQTADQFISALVEVFRDIRRVLRDDGTVWLNLGDSYAKDGQRQMIPARVALALQCDGWLLRDEIIWHKPRTTPGSFKNRTVPGHEMIYLFAKAPGYYYDYLAIEEPAKYAGQTRQKTKVFRRLRDSRVGTKNQLSQIASDTPFTVRDTRRKRSVWSISPSPYKDAHFATFPPGLIEPCILAGSPLGGTVFDPFGGSGTTALVALKHGRNAVLCELNFDYVEIAHKRIRSEYQM